MCLELFSERAREVRENRTFAGRGIIHVCQVIDFSCTRNTRMDAKPPRQPYPSDLIDTEWTLLQPLLLPPQPGGRHRTTDLREILNAIFYLSKNGCSWKALPHDFPPEGTVRDYFHTWRRRGVWEQIQDTLRRQVRRHAGRADEPSAGIIDSQSVKAWREKGVGLGFLNAKGKMEGKNGVSSVSAARPRKQN